MIQVMIVDDHRIVRQGIKELIDDKQTVSVIAAVPNLSEARATLSQFEIDVVLQDISLQNNENGIEFTKEITAQYPRVKVIGLTMHNEPSMIKQMIKHGAKGYVLKDASKEELMEAIVIVANGGKYFSNKVQDTIMSSLSGGPNVHADSLPKLSRREKEILQLIVDENTTAEIAEKLFVTPGTVETHRRNMLSKLGVRNTAGLVRIAYEQKLLDD